MYGNQGEKDQHVETMSTVQSKDGRNMFISGRENASGTTLSTIPMHQVSIVD